MLSQIMETALSAGKKIIEAGNKSMEIENKSGKGNFVTQFDVEVQNFIKSELKNKFPEAAFMGEEDGENVYVDSELIFIADPIDGTTNFIRDFKHSCVSIALLKNGKPYIGVVYDPYLGEMFTAELGRGAFLNDRKIHVSDGGLDNALVSFGTAPYYPEFKETTFDTAMKVFGLAADLRRCGSSALDICYVAAGRTDLYFEYIISPWDFAASSLILCEAGGIIKTNGFQDIDYRKSGAVVAANPKALKDFKNLIDF